MKRTVSGAPDVQSAMEPGQIEQVVSSADCRSASSVSAETPSVSSIQATIRGGETAGTSSPGANQPTPQPTFIGSDWPAAHLCVHCGGTGYAPSAGEATPERAQDLIAEGDANDQPILSLEDRLLVALAGRGAQRIWELFDRVLSSNPFLEFASDEALVEAVEGAGDALGLPAAERQERNGRGLPDSARTGAVE